MSDFKGNELVIRLSDAFKIKRHSDIENNLLSIT